MFALLFCLHISDIKKITEHNIKIKWKHKLQLCFGTQLHPDMFLCLCTHSLTVTVDTNVLPLKSTRNMGILIAIALKQRNYKKKLRLLFWTAMCLLTKRNKTDGYTVVFFPSHQKYVNFFTGTILQSWNDRKKLKWCLLSSLYTALVH